MFSLSSEYPVICPVLWRHTALVFLSFSTTTKSSSTTCDLWFAPTTSWCVPSTSKKWDMHDLLLFRKNRRGARSVILQGHRSVKIPIPRRCTSVSLTRNVVCRRYTIITRVKITRVILDPGQNDGSVDAALYTHTNIHTHTYIHDTYIHTYIGLKLCTCTHALA